jgi:hypothetical protein
VLQFDIDMIEFRSQNEVQAMQAQMRERGELPAGPPPQQ